MTTTPQYLWRKRCISGPCVLRFTKSGARDREGLLCVIEKRPGATHIRVFNNYRQNRMASDIIAAGEALLNFSAPLDVGTLDSIVGVFHDATNPNQVSLTLMLPT